MIKNGEDSNESTGTDLVTLDPRPRLDRAQKNSFAKRLGQAIHGRGIRQADLARATGLQPYHISSYTTGRAAPSRINLEIIAKTLGVDPHSLMPEAKPIEEVEAEERPLINNSPMALTVNPRNPAEANLRINMTVRTELGAEIIRLLLQDQSDLDRVG